MEIMTKERRDELMDFYLNLNTHELEYLLCLSAERIIVPVDKGDDGVHCQEVIYANINGATIDLITEEFNEAINREMKKSQDKQIDNLLNDE